MSPPDFLKALLDAAIASAHPNDCLPAYLPKPPRGKTVVVGFGKASAAMAQTLERHWPGPLSGLVITRYGYAVSCERIQIVEAAHPVPDESGLNASLRIFELVRGLSEDDLVICLISGGGSSLFALPAPGLTLADKQSITQALLRSGATIAEINCLRKHLSASKGGRLALACAPAQVLTLAISDVPGDDPAIIASGPTTADPTTCNDALQIARRYRISLPQYAEEQLTSGTGETPKPGMPCFARGTTHLIATPQKALEAAAAYARKVGIQPHILSDRMEGETRHVAKVHAAIARQIAFHAQPFSAPCVLLSGGETTVSVQGNGRGGRNTEFILALQDDLREHPGIYALAADTDGIDGTEDNAGAIHSPDAYSRAIALGMLTKNYLADNNSYDYFKALDQLLITGPTLTNVNDFRAILIAPGRAN